MNSMRTMEIQTSLMKTKNDGKPVVMNKESHQLERNILNLAINAFGRMQDIAQGSIDESSGDIFLRGYNEANALICLASLLYNGMSPKIVEELQEIGIGILELRDDMFYLMLELYGDNDQLKL